MFDGVIRTTNGSTSGVKLLVNETSIDNETLSVPFCGKKVNINELRKILENCGSDRLEKIAKIYDLNLNGDFKTCEQFAIVKAKDKNVNKE
jgi:hypothetical protein